MYTIYPNDGIPYLRPQYARDKHHTLFSCRAWSPHVWITDEAYPQHVYSPGELQECKALTASTIEKMMMAR